MSEDIPIEQIVQPAATEPDGTSREVTREAAEEVSFRMEEIPPS